MTSVETRRSGRGRRDPANNPALVIFASCSAVIIVTGTFAGAINAIPFIGRDVSASQSQLQWVGDSYQLALAALLLPAGALLDRYGRKRGLVGGMVLLTLCLVWSGLATTIDQLIVSRIAAGIGAALVFPGTLATLTTVIPEERRGRAIGFWAAATIVGGVAGLVLAGAMLEVAWWGSVFLAMAGCAAACAVLMALVIPETRDPAHANPDPIGAALSLVAIGGLVFAITQGPLDGWTNPVTLVAIAVGLMAAAAFWVWEGRFPRPLLARWLFANRSFATSTVAIFVVFAVDYGFFFLMFQYEAFVLGYGSLKSALGLLPAGAAMFPVAVAGPSIARRLGRRVTIAASFFICAVGTGSAVALAQTASYWALLLPIGFFFVGIGLGMGPMAEAVVESLPAAEQGVASAVNDTARELGAAVGIAFLGSTFNAGYRARVGHLTHARAGLGAILKVSPSAGLQAASGLGADARSAISIVQSGVIAGWHAALLSGTGVLLVAGTYMAVRFPAHRTSARAGELTEPQ